MDLWLSTPVGLQSALAYPLSWKCLLILFAGGSDILKGEELTYDYVPAYQESRKAKRYQEGVKCLCGQPACRKFIWAAR